MRRARLSIAILSAFGIAASASAKAADAPSPEDLLAGTRWMEIGVFDTIENIAPEKMLLLRLCTIADIAFTMVDGKLTKFDREGLAGRSMPRGYANVIAEPGRNGGTLVTLRSASDSRDAPEAYLIDRGGEILHAQVNGANGSAYMKCRMGTPAELRPFGEPGAAR